MSSTSFSLSTIDDSPKNYLNVSFDEESSSSMEMVTFQNKFCGKSVKVAYDVLFDEKTKIPGDSICLKFVISHGNSQTLRDIIIRVSSLSIALGISFDNLTSQFKKERAAGDVGTSIFSLIKEKTEKEYFLDLANQGVKDAQVEYALMCLEGKGGDVDLVNARSYFKLAADQGVKEAQYNYALMCFLKRGGCQNLVDARLYFKFAANQGVGEAAFKYAQICFLVQSSIQDLVEARDYFRCAASNLHLESQFYYALMCYSGSGGGIDLASSAYYSKIAADKGHAEAQHLYASIPGGG
jgi:hypothetical protein